MKKLNKMNIKTQRKIKKLIEAQKTIAEIKKKLKDQKLTTGNIYAVAKTFNLKITKSKMERIASNPNFQTLLIQKTAGLITTQEMADLLNVPFSTLYSFLKNKK